MRRVLLVALLVLALPGCKVMQRISDGSYNNAVTDGVTTELEDRGIRLEARPSCETRDSGSSVVHVECTATTTTGEPVTVKGVAADADTAHPRETYLVTVAGRQVLRQHCLGTGCDGSSPATDPAALARRGRTPGKCNEIRMARESIDTLCI